MAPLYAAPAGISHGHQIGPAAALAPYRDHVFCVVVVWVNLQFRPWALGSPRVTSPTRELVTRGGIGPRLGRLPLKSAGGTWMAPYAQACCRHTFRAFFGLLGLFLLLAPFEAFLYLPFFHFSPVFPGFPSHGIGTFA